MVGKTNQCHLGASVSGTWSSRAHFPALRASGCTTEEAFELAVLAKSNGRVRVGLQARVNPAVSYMRELVASGYVGEIGVVHDSCATRAGTTAALEQTRHSS
jgi:hypothetical protein